MPPDDYYEGYETVQNKINPDGVLRYMIETHHCPLCDWDFDRIAKAFGLGVGTMRAFIKRNGLDARLEDEVMGKVNYIEVEDLYNQGKSDSEICKALKISAPTVGVWRKKNNLQPNGQKANKQPPPEYMENHVDMEKAKAEIRTEFDKHDKPEPRIVINGSFDAVNALIANNHPVEIVITKPLIWVPDKPDTINKDWDDAINKMIIEMPAVELRKAVATPDPMPTYVEAPADPAVVNVPSVWESDCQVGALTTKSIAITEPDPWKLIEQLEDVIVFLKGIAIGAGVRDINRLIDEVIGA